MARRLTASARELTDLRAVVTTRPELYRGRAWRAVDVVVPPGGDANDASVRRRLVDLGVDVAFSFYCYSIFRRPLLDAFAQAVNYHDGLLPRYRGAQATSFAVYHGEPEVGFTFHRMVESVDGGPILCQGSVPVGPSEAIASVTRRVCEVAVATFPSVVGLVDAGDPGRPQTGPSSRCLLSDVRALVEVPDPSSVTAGELRRRVRAFGTVHLTIGGQRYPVRALRSAGRGGALAFATADGERLAPARIGRLPPSVWRARAAVSRRRTVRSSAGGRGSPSPGGESNP